MALTTAQQTDLYKLAVGMYGVAPGTVHLNTLSNAVNAGMSMTQIYNALASDSSFASLGFAYTGAATNEQFATAFVNNLLGNSVTDPTNKQIAVDFVVARLNAGESRGQAMQTAINTLASVPTTDANFGAARQQLDNKIEVARYYTETLNGNATSLSTLQNIIVSVTQDTGTVQTAKDAASTTTGSAFTLSANADSGSAFTGKSSNDTFNGNIIADNGTGTTFGAGDNLTGAAGTDTLAVAVSGASTNELLSRAPR